jgi:hypothetical protein
MADPRKVAIAAPPAAGDDLADKLERGQPMKRFRVMLAAVLLAVATGSIAPTHSSQDNPKPLPTPNLSGLHDFDRMVGRWNAHHRRLKERLAGSHEWVEFDGTSHFFLLMDGFANTDENVFKMPSGEYRGVTLRAYDPKTGDWAIWWLDGRNPFGELDPPVKGHFVNGVGTFYSDDMLRGKRIRVRFIWSKMTSTSAHWEQAFSPDGGKTWETNWYTDFRRAS